MKSNRGFFVSFEGIEGSGKSTQMRLLVERLRASGLEVVQNQEPGTTVIGKQVRRLLLDPANAEMAPMTELLLMFASRTQAAAEIVRPALERGEIVVSDRFTDSTLAYQGFARDLGVQTVLAMHELVLGSLLPDLTILLGIDVEVGLDRALRRNRESDTDRLETRIDQHSLEFHARVAAGYRQIAAKESGRFRIVDGTGEPAQIAECIWSLVGRLVCR